MGIRLYTAEELRRTHGEQFNLIKEVDISSSCQTTPGATDRILINFSEGVIQGETFQTLQILQVNGASVYSESYRLDSALSGIDPEAFESLKDSARWYRMSVEKLQNLIAQENPW